MTPLRPFLLVGLTGGIATGKSTVDAVLRERGAVIIDADVVAREVVEPGEPALAEITAEFGPGVLGPDGRLDRKALGAIVFADPDRRRKLEALTHPRMRQRLQRRIDELTAENFRGLVFYDAAVLIESGSHHAMDRIVVVVTDEPTQIARLMARDRIDREETLRKIRSQIPLAEKAKLADYVIDNSGDPSATRASTERVFRALFRECACSLRFIDHVAPLAVLFPKGIGIYKQRNVPPVQIAERFRSALGSVEIIAYHWRRSGNIVVRDPGPALLTMAAARAEEAIGSVVLARQFPELQRVEWAWPTDFVGSPDHRPGQDVHVAVMLSMTVPETHWISGRLGSRVEVVRWVSARDVLCLYRRPSRNGSLGHVSMAVEAALKRRGVPQDVQATARSMGVITNLLDGTGLIQGRDR